MPVSNTVHLTDDEFESRFRPLPHPTAPGGASFDGTMLETYGKDVAHVQETYARAPLTVWTVLDCDGRLIITNGFHFVNRFGYIITEIPFDAAESFEVYDDETDSEEQ
jgi:hypothetical protein